MGYEYTTGSIPISTGSTGTKITLKGRAKIIYLRVDAPAFLRLQPSDGSTAISTSIGLPFATGQTHEIKLGSPPPKYCYIVTNSTASKGFVIAEYN